MSLRKGSRAELKHLLKKARNTFPTPEEIEEHRRSFAYGNAALANPAVTRAMVDRAAEKLIAGAGWSTTPPPA